MCNICDDFRSKAKESYTKKLKEFNWNDCWKNFQGSPVHERHFIRGSEFYL